MDEENKFKIKPFNGNKDDDFMFYSMRIITYLESLEIADIVTGDRLMEKPGPDASKAAEKRYEEYLKNERKAKSIIISSLGDRPLRGVQSAEKNPRASGTTPGSLYKPFY